MSDTTDNLPSYPAGLDVYPPSYMIRIPKQKLFPIEVADKSDEYKRVFKEVINRDDSLLSTDDEGKPCIVLADLTIVYITEENNAVQIVTEDGTIVETDDPNKMNKSLTMIVAEIRKQKEEASKQSVDHDSVEAAGAVMYDHTVLGDISATELVNMKENT